MSGKLKIFRRAYVNMQVFIFGAESFCMNKLVWLKVLKCFDKKKLLKTILIGKHLGIMENES